MANEEAEAFKAASLARQVTMAEFTQVTFDAVLRALRRGELPARTQNNPKAAVGRAVAPPVPAAGVVPLVSAGGP